MSGEALRMDALLESVADGSAVDWDSIDAAAITEEERRMVRHLRLVAGIADVHRTIPLDEAPMPAPVFDLDTQPVPRWGHLLLLEKIGEGTFGEVYRARDPWLDREVALKLLRPTVTGPGRVVSEAQALARLRHPNVVTVHGADMNDGRAGLWMEFVRGRTLSDIVGTDGPLSAAEAAVAGQELCRALTAVHGAGLIHRDVKAQNVMRESGGRLVLMDFGAGHTPLYLAPELLSG
jgi:serine/threonine protein kinase